jgi:molecular chaperone DnaK
LIKTNNSEENFEYSQQLETIRVGLIETQISASLINDDDVSDAKFQLDDRKRKLIQNFDDLTRNKLIAQEIEEYNEAKLNLEYHLNKEENERYQDKYARIIKNEREVINSGNKYLIRAKIKELDELYDAVIQSSDENFITYFLNLKFVSEFSNQRKADKLIKQGDESLDKKDYKSLRHIVYGLSALLPDYEKEKQKKFKDDSRTGLG